MTWLCDLHGLPDDTFAFDDSLNLPLAPWGWLTEGVGTLVPLVKVNTLLYTGYLSLPAAAFIKIKGNTMIMFRGQWTHPIWAEILWQTAENGWFHIFHTSGIRKRDQTTLATSQDTTHFIFSLDSRRRLSLPESFEPPPWFVFLCVWLTWKHLMNPGGEKTKGQKKVVGFIDFLFLPTDGCKLGEAHMLTLLNSRTWLILSIRGFSVCTGSCQAAGNHFIGFGPS